MPERWMSSCVMTLTAAGEVNRPVSFLLAKVTWMLINCSRGMSAHELVELVEPASAAPASKQRARRGWRAEPVSGTSRTNF